MRPRGDSGHIPEKRGCIEPLEGLDVGLTAR